ncbi:MAG: hypothetical protein Q7R41_17590 [Phycisphaerales bacterium]|nr:hypothetical protein [Phycisphaerales bacterium]
MELSSREFWALVHGIVFGSAFLLAFAGGFAGFWSLRPEFVTEAGVTERIRRMVAGTVGMAVVAWATVLTGTWIVYPWYREKAPTSARSQLLADPNTSDWHEFGMEWKEHAAWLVPMLATAAAFVVLYYREDLVRNKTARRLGLALLTGAFAVAAIVGLLGALITKNASV